MLLTCSINIHLEFTAGPDTERQDQGKLGLLHTASELSHVAVFRDEPRDGNFWLALCLGVFFSMKSTLQYWV